MEYTVDDELLIGREYEALLTSCEKIVKDEEGWESIKKAFFLAKEAHKGMRRRSGEPYVIHPIAVARIVVDEIGLGVKSVTSALLHDIVEDTAYTIEDLEVMFGAKIASMVDGLTKMSGTFTAETSEQAENFRKMLLTLSDDVRVILIKIADRLHNMRTLGSMPTEKQVKTTSETIYLFAPLAYRLGLYSIKSELEDLSLKYRFPEQYDEIKGKLLATDAVRQKFIQNFNAPIKELLTDSGIDFEISGRVKSVWSIWSKMQRKQVPFEDIYDLFAIRIVFQPSPLIPEKSQSWHIYSLVTDIYKPKPDRLRDWISMPKANGYEALHATVMGPEGVWVEVQIRSQRMEDIAERGFAAHWKYKDENIGDDQDELDKWLLKIRDALNSPSDSALDFLDNFKMSLYTSEIVVFTPKGESRTMPYGASALDFAYDIHTKIGDHAIGAKINHRIESIFTPISSGDQIEVITSESAVPKPEWLEHVVTAKARQSIKNYLKRDKENSIEQGIQIFDERLSGLGITPSGRVFRKVLPAYNVHTKDEFYSKLGAGIINIDDLESVLRQNSASKMLKFWSVQPSNPLKVLTGDKKEKDDLPTVDPELPEFSIATCCNPIPGDPVIGYSNPVTGTIDVHKTSCEVLTKLAAQFGDRITAVKWSSHKAMSYLTKINVRGIDRIGILMELTEVITGELNTNIRELNIRSHDGIFEGDISLYVKNINDLNLVMDKVNQIKGIEVVKRVKSFETI